MYYSEIEQPRHHKKAIIYIKVVDSVYIFFAALCQGGGQHMKRILTFFSVEKPTVVSDEHNREFYCMILFA